MIFEVRTRAIVATLMLGACGCPDLDSSSGADSFVGIKGTVYEIYRCSSAWDKCASPIRDQRVLRVFVEPTLALAGTARTDNSGHFALSLTPGNYRVEILPPAALIDEIGVVEVTPQGGMRLVRVYYEVFDVGVLLLTFSATVPDTRRQQIINAEDLRVLSSDGEEWFVGLGADEHPQDVGETLLAKYAGEVTDYRFAMGHCPN